MAAQSSVPTTKQQFGKRLKHLRVMSDRTISDAARDLGVSSFSISQWESGRTTPRYATCLQLARTYNVAPRVLITPLTEKEEKSLASRLDANRHQHNGQRTFSMLQTATL